ncbi:hypothetical protein VKT23_015129 [Stygiomarasmius scandens]|uniref:Uncharacterized protein n=1 Tax=Marasmiellus scandens TaxID=2682957 RepID=A0ABR1J397_9AGAR
MFRNIQALTGAVISGSTALQFFSRIRWEESDLDIYVEHSSGYIVALFLIAIGYGFQPINKQKPTIADAYDQVDLTNFYDDGRGFAGVFNFERRMARIQLITATYSPIDIILNFHSTVVINLITAKHAVCLYPRATFEEGTSLITFRDEGLERSFAREKYVQRGWTLVNADGSLWTNPYDEEDSDGNASDPDSDLGLFSLDSFEISVPRYVGDRFSWTIDLPPLRTASRDYLQETLAWMSTLYRPVSSLLVTTASRDEIDLFMAHSWTLVHRGLTATASYIIFQDPVLTFAYCCDRQRPLFDTIHLWILDIRQKTLEIERARNDKWRPLVSVLKSIIVQMVGPELFQSEKEMYVILTY